MLNAALGGHGLRFGRFGSRSLTLRSRSRLIGYAGRLRHNLLQILGVHDFTADKIVSDEAPAEEGMMEYTEYVDPKNLEKIMAETASMTDEPAPASQRKGPGSETAEPEPVATEGGV